MERLPPSKETWSPQSSKQDREGRKEISRCVAARPAVVRGKVLPTQAEEMLEGYRAVRKARKTLRKEWQDLHNYQNAADTAVSDRSSIQWSTDVLAMCWFGWMEILCTIESKNGA